MISIVTISFNQARYLRQCLDSVVAQKNGLVEYIVVDPGSTDGSREILEEYSTHIDCLILEEDEGPSDGLNKGFSVANGEVGYFLNSDDYLLPGAVQRMAQLWSEFRGVDLLLGGAWLVDEVGLPIRELYAGAISLPSLAGRPPSMVQQGMSFKMSKYRSVGGFNPLNQTCWDYELLVAMLSHGCTSKLLQDRFAAFRLYEESISGGVLGREHELRYRSDLKRIRNEFSDFEGLVLKRDYMMENSILKHLFSPRRAANRIADRFLPGLMRKRWARDMQIRNGRD
ncbi:MAG: glycosyltransferase [Halioglobus sp.]